MQVFDFHWEIHLKGLLLPEIFFSKKLNLGSFHSSKGYIHLMRLVTFMKQFKAFVSKFRINALLSCSAAVLLTACGGNVDAGGQQLAATAAGVTTDASAAAAASTVALAAPAAATEAVEAVAEAAPAAATEAGTAAVPAASTAAAPAAGTAGATAQAANVTAQAFELTGYDSSPLQAQAGQQDAGASAPAPIKQ